jgi:ribosome-binding factor A
MGMVTVSHVDVTTDLAHAKVYVSVFNEDDIVESIKILNKAGGYLRHQLGRNLRLRTIPELRFVYDKSISHGTRLSALIDAAVSTDMKNKEQGK